MPQQLSTNTFTTAKWIVSPTASDGTHTTIQSAINSASSGDVIVVRPGTYTENLALVPGITLISMLQTGNGTTTTPVTVNGQITMTSAGGAEIEGFNLSTNGADLVSLTGSAAVNIRFYNCRLVNTSGFTFLTSTNANAVVIYDNCSLKNIDGSTKVFNITACSAVNFVNGTKQYQTGTASTIAAGTLTLDYVSGWESPITTSGTAGLFVYYSFIPSANNTTITCGGSGSHQFFYSSLNGGTSPAIAVNTTVTMQDCLINSTNTNAISGTGTLQSTGLRFPSTSTGIASTVIVTPAGAGITNAWCLIGTQNASGSANLSFTNIPNTIFNNYVLVFSGVTASTTAPQLQCQISTNNGVSYIATGYLSGVNAIAYNGTTLTNSSSTTSFIFASGFAASAQSAGTVYFLDFQGTMATKVYGQSWLGNPASSSNIQIVQGSNTNTTAVNAIQLSMTSGNISTGKFMLYGIAQ